MNRLSAEGRVVTAITILLIIIFTGFGIWGVAWGTAEGEKNRQKDLQIIKICTEGKEVPACAKKR